eukprot:9546950-Alexandrium_andersonii.AAC.1
MQLPNSPGHVAMHANTRSPRPTPVPAIKTQRVGLRESNAQYAIRRPHCGWKPLRSERSRPWY